MDRQKVIGINYFINEQATKVKLRTIAGQEVRVFPLYVIVTFDQKSTKFKANIFGKEILVDEELRQLSQPRIKSKLDLFEGTLKNIIYGEYEERKSNFSLAGIGKRLTKYYERMDIIFGQITLVDIVAELKRSKSDFHFKAFIDIASILIEINSDIPIYDWKYGGGKVQNENLKMVPTAAAFNSDFSDKEAMAEYNRLLAFIQRKVDTYLFE